MSDLQSRRLPRACASGARFHSAGCSEKAAAFRLRFAVHLLFDDDPGMSRLRQRIFRKKFDDLIAVADDRAFFVMCWAVRALQSERVNAARPFLSFPKEAAERELTGPFSIYPWFIETMINELLTVPKAPARTRRPDRVLNCSNFDAIAIVRNRLRELENAEDGIRLQNVSVFEEMPRLAQRQFEWQRGFLSMPQVYRAGFLYGGDHTSKHFQHIAGFSVTEFSHACFAISAGYRLQPEISLDADFTGADLPRDLSRRVMEHLSLTLNDARSQAVALRSAPGHVGYKKSVLRTHPCVVFQGKAVAPLVELVNLRGTSGIFYDVIGGPDAVKNEISARFEKYCLDFTRAMMPNTHVDGEIKYLFNSNYIKSPDMLIYRQNQLAIIMECKATRMSYEARFGEEPLVEAARGYDEMAKGIFQIWRFVSHIRRGYVTDVQIANDVKGVVITLDAWLSMARHMIVEVFVRARRLATERDPEISADDQIPVRFCMIDDLEKTLAKSTQESFLNTIAGSMDDEHRSWMLASIHDKLNPEVGIFEREFPFSHRLAEVQGTWWQTMEDRARRKT